jgi:transcription antitermination protein NusB
VSRRVGRELALRALFMVEQGKLSPGDAFVQARLSLSRGKSSDPAFAEQLVHGVLTNLRAIDEAVAPHLRRWSTGQMPVVDHTILRIAAYELLFTDQPLAAVIDEAVTLSKIYGTVESGRFVNGVLGSLARARTSLVEPATPTAPNSQ